MLLWNDVLNINKFNKRKLIMWSYLNVYIQGLFLLNMRLWTRSSYLHALGLSIFPISVAALPDKKVVSSLSFCNLLCQKENIYKLKSTA